MMELNSGHLNKCFIVSETHNNEDMLFVNDSRKLCANNYVLDDKTSVDYDSECHHLSLSYNKMASETELSQSKVEDNSSVSESVDLISLDDYRKSLAVANFVATSDHSFSNSFSSFRSSLVMTTKSFYGATSSLEEIPSFDRKASTTLTILSILGMIQGSTILAIPFVVARGGVLILLSLIPVGAVACYSCLAIIDSQYVDSKSSPRLSKRVYATYIDLGIASLPPNIGGKIMKLVTFSSLLTEVYTFILIGQSTYDLLCNYVPFSVAHYSLLWGLMLLPCLFITRVSILAWFSSFCLLSFTIVTCLIFTYLFLSFKAWNLDNLNVSFSLEYFLIGYGIILNSFNFHWVVPAVEGSMRQPEKARRAFVTAMSASVVIKFVMCALSVLTIGKATEQSITTNLFANSYIAVLANIALIMCIYLYLPMGLYVVLEMYDLYILPYFPIFGKTGIRFFAWQFLTRLTSVVCVLFLAVSVPQFGIVVSIIGSIRGTLVVLTLPLCFHLKLKWATLGTVTKTVELFIIIITALLGIGGAIYSAKVLIFGL